MIIKRQIQMARCFIKGNKKQTYLFPHLIDDWISKDHPIRFILVCLEQINLGNVFLDGTKIKAYAALSSNCTIDYINKILKEAKTVDKAEDKKFGESQCGDCLPKKLINSEERIK